MSYWGQMWTLFVAFMQANLLGFGGGPGTIPFIKEQVVDTHHWLTASGFADALAFGNSLPGPIATKLAAYVGYKAGGYMGAAAALLATILPTALAMILLLRLFLLYKDSPYVSGAITAVKPIVVVLLLQVAYSLGQNSFPNYIAWGIGAAGLVLVFLLKVNPAYVIAGALAFGAIIKL